MMIFSLKDWQNLPELKIKKIKSMKEAGSIYHVIKVGVFPNETNKELILYPTIKIRENNREQLYRLPLESNFYGMLSPREVEFCNIDGKFMVKENKNMNLKKLLTIMKTIFSNGWLPIGNTYIMKTSNPILYGKKYDFDVYKIGNSIEPEKRRKEIKYTYKKDNCVIEEMELLAVFPYDIEEILHNEFKKNKIVGEWFKYSKNLGKLILLFKFYDNWKYKLLEFINTFPEDKRIGYTRLYNGELLESIKWRFKR